MVCFINYLDYGGDKGDFKTGRVQACWRIGLDVKMLLLLPRKGLHKIGCS